MGFELPMRLRYCRVPNEEHPCTALGLVEPGFAFTPEGLMLYDFLPGYEGTVAFTYAQLAKPARKGSLLDKICKLNAK